MGQRKHSEQTLLAERKKELVKSLPDFESAKNTRMSETDYLIDNIDEETITSVNFVNKIRTQVFKQLPCFSNLRIDNSPARSVDDIVNCLNLYQEITNKINEKIKYIPLIEDYTSLLGIARSTLHKYRNSKGLDYEDAINMVYDYVGGFISQGTMTGSIKEVSGIFTLKSTLGYKDQDMEITINNNTLNIGSTTDEVMSVFRKLKAGSKD